EQACLDDLDQTMDEVRASTLRELGRPDWDPLVSVFTQTDRVAHMFYRFLDPDHPRYDAVLAARFGDAVLRVYQRMDTIVGEALARLGPGAALLDAIARGLEAEVDPATGERFVARVYKGREIFPGAPPERMPDLQLAFRDGYRTSWRTPLGGIPKDLLEPNLKKWSGDHAASD